MALQNLLVTRDLVAGQALLENKEKEAAVRGIDLALGNAINQFPSGIFRPDGVQVKLLDHLHAVWSAEYQRHAEKFSISREKWEKEVVDAIRSADSGSAYNAMYENTLDALKQPHSAERTQSEANPRSVFGVINGWVVVRPRDKPDDDASLDRDVWFSSVIGASTAFYEEADGGGERVPYADFMEHFKILRAGHLENAAPTVWPTIPHATTETKAQAQVACVGCLEQEDADRVPGDYEVRGVVTGALYRVRWNGTDWREVGGFENFGILSGNPDSTKSLRETTESVTFGLPLSEPKG